MQGDLWYVEDYEYLPELWLRTQVWNAARASSHDVARRIFEGSPVAMKAEHLANLRYNYVESLAETLVFALLKFLPWTAV